MILLKQTDSYADAREYLKLMSEGESAPKTNKPLGKGHRKQKKRSFLVENFEGNDDENDADLIDQITPPPTIKIPKKTPMVSSEAYNENKKILRSCSSETKNALDLEAHKRTIIRTVSSEFIETRISLPTVAATDTAAYYNHTVVPPAALSNCGCKIEESTILKSILSNVITVKMMLEQLTSDERNKTTDNNNIITDFNLVPKKPSSKYKKLKKFDETIKTDQKANHQNETALFLLGGASPKEMIRCLKKLFSDKLAIKCSWTGRKNNFPLNNLKIMEVIKIAIRKRFGNDTDAEFQAEVGLWFRQGKLRFDRSQAVIMNIHNQDKTLEETTDN